MKYRLVSMYFTIHNLEDCNDVCRHGNFTEDSSDDVDDDIIIINRDSRDSAVGIGIDYELDGRGVGVRIPVKARFIASPRRP
jgi:hypothetical protein